MQLDRCATPAYPLELLLVQVGSSCVAPSAYAGGTWRRPDDGTEMVAGPGDVTSRLSGHDA
jgi:hypothetical protein